MGALSYWSLRFFLARLDSASSEADRFRLSIVLPNVLRTSSGRIGIMGIDGISGGSGYTLSSVTSISCILVQVTEVTPSIGGRTCILSFLEL